MTGDQRDDRVTDEAQGTSGRTGQSLGELTQRRGDPSGKRLDLSEPTTAPLQDEDHDDAVEGEEGARVGIGTTPGAVDEISEVAAGADFGEGDPGGGPGPVER